MINATEISARPATEYLARLRADAATHRTLVAGGSTVKNRAARFAAVALVLVLAAPASAISLRPVPILRPPVCQPFLPVQGGSARTLPVSSEMQSVACPHS